MKISRKKMKYYFLRNYLKTELVCLSCCYFRWNLIYLWWYWTHLPSIESKWEAAPQPYLLLSSLSLSLFSIFPVWTSSMILWLILQFFHLFNPPIKNHLNFIFNFHRLSSSPFCVCSFGWNLRSFQQLLLRWEIFQGSARDQDRAGYPQGSFWWLNKGKTTFGTDHYPWIF